MRPGPPVVGALLAIVFAALPAPAQTLASFRFQVDNDAFDFWLPSVERPDNNYTHGQHLRTVLNVTPRWTRRGFPDCRGMANSPSKANACAQSFLTIAQLIFTPTHDSFEPIPGERPYAGFLYADLGRLIVDHRQSRALGIRIGTTGHASGADAAQRLFHHLADQYRPQGWEHQVATVPVIGLTYGRRYFLTPALVSRRFALQVIANGAATASNIQTGMNSGLELRAGYNAPHPWMAGAEAGRHGFRAYVMLGSTEEWVARDVLLEGNTSRTIGLVSKRPFVFQSVWGLGAGVGSYSLEYRGVSRSREYDTGPSWHRWGTISIVRGIP